MLCTMTCAMLLTSMVLLPCYYYYIAVVEDFEEEKAYFDAELIKDVTEVDVIV